MTTEIKIKNIPTGYQSIINSGKHTIIGDEPVDVKGTDLGMTPTQLVLAGISMCKVATIRNVARKKNIDIGEVDAELSQATKKNSDGSYTTEVNAAIKIDGNITEEQKAVLFKKADNCYVTRLLRGDWIINNSSELN